MKEFLRAPVGFVLLGALGFADPVEPVPFGATPEFGEEDWLAFENEISAFAAASVQVGTDAGWTMLLRNYYTVGSKAVSTGPGGDEISGFSFQDVDLTLWRSIGEFDFRASLDLVDNNTTNLLVEDAYVLFDFTSHVLTTWGQFKAPAFNSGIVSPENQLFIDRSAIGSAFDSYDLGMMAGGKTEFIDWAAWVQNGSSNQAKDHVYGFRLAWHAGAGSGHYEGARDKDDGLNGTVGFVFLHDDTNKGDNQAFGLDFNGNYDRFGFGLELLLLDDEFDSLGTNARDFGVIAAGSLNFDDGPKSSATAHAVTVSYVLNNRMEVGIRSESLDNTEETILRSAVFNFHQLRNLAKFSLQWTHVDTNNADTEGHYFQAGLSVGASR